MLLRRLMGDVIQFAYPGRCAVCASEACGSAAHDDAAPNPDPLLCGQCAAGLDEVSSVPMCPRCAMPIGSLGGGCPHCLGKGSFPFDSIIALGVYRDPLKEMIHQAKYSHRWMLAELLADRLLARPSANRLLQRAQRIVGVPLHWSRHWSRGYNQAEIIAARLRRANPNLPLARPLSRVKKTDSQALIHSQADRATNLRHAFGLISAKSIQGKHIVLVDDVTTTGETLKAAARAMKSARPASISAIVLAVADPRRRDFQTI